jgi:hypothetical protein
MLILKIDEFSFDILYSSILIIFIFLLSIFIISKNSILKNNQYTTLGLIIFSGFIYKTQLNSFIILSYLTLLLSIRKIYSLKTPKKTNKKLFDIGFWFSLSTILNPFNFIFLATIFFGIYAFYKLDLKTILQFFAGYISTLLISILFTSLSSGFSFNSVYLVETLESFILEFHKCYECPNLAFPQILFPSISLLVFLLYLFKYFGNNLHERLKNSFLLIFYLNSILMIFIIEDYTIFLFFPFLVTLIRIISHLRRSLFFELVIVLAILLNSFSF